MGQQQAGCGVWGLGAGGQQAEGFPMGRLVPPSPSPVVFPGTGRKWAHRGPWPQVSHQEGTPAIGHTTGPCVARPQPSRARHSLLRPSQPGGRGLRTQTHLSSACPGKGPQGSGGVLELCWTPGLLAVRRAELSPRRDRPLPWKHGNPSTRSSWTQRGENTAHPVQPLATTKVLI